MANLDLDAVARRLANDVSRRHFLTSIHVVAAALFAPSTWRTVKAQTSGIVLGGICMMVNDCRRTDMATIACADNGIPTDGALNCCVS
ncbi:MAG: hypothetical protein M3509_10065, partial [Chloroflexota bacterium]|nr:hypothetical protein [Chloroflexota bacterium]